MPIVNYVREHIRFMEYATDEHLTSGERLLWYALMHIMNQHAQGKVWPDEFIRISNDRLLSYCPMKYDTIASARNSLKQRGLIEFTPGEKNKKSPAYRMNYFYPECIAPDTESDADNPRGNTEKSDYNGGNIGYNIGGNSRGNKGYNTGGNIGDFNINSKDIRIPHVFQKDFDDDDKKQEQAYARARAEAETAWKVHFGKPPTPSMLHELAWRTVLMEFDEGVLTEAIRVTASKGASSPMEYVITVLCDWRDHKVKTVSDVDEYSFIFDAMHGKYPAGVSPLEGYDAEKAFRENRETEEERERREEYEAERQKRAAMISANKEERKRQEYQQEKERLDRRYGVTA